MPRGRTPVNGFDGPSADDLAEFMQLLGGSAAEQLAFPLAEGSLGRLIEAVTHKGWAVRVAPVLGGKARTVVLYVGEQKIERYSSDPDQFEEEVRRLLMAVPKLPARRG